MSYGRVKIENVGGLRPHLASPFPRPHSDCPCALRMSINILKIEFLVFPVTHNSFGA